jgi:hypothetical protein
VGARPWLASPINSALLIAFTPGSLSLGGIGFRVLTISGKEKKKNKNFRHYRVIKKIMQKGGQGTTGA